MSLIKSLLLEFLSLHCYCMVVGWLAGQRQLSGDFLSGGQTQVFSLANKRIYSLPFIYLFSFLILIVAFLFL